MSPNTESKNLLKESHLIDFPADENREMPKKAKIKSKIKDFFLYKEKKYFFNIRADQVPTERRYKSDMIYRKIKTDHIRFITNQIEKILNKKLKFRLWKHMSINMKKSFNRNLYNMKIITFLLKYSQNLDEILSKEKLVKKRKIPETEIKQQEETRKSKKKRYRKQKPYNHEEIVELQRNAFSNIGLRNILYSTLKNYIKRKYFYSLIRYNKHKKMMNLPNKDETYHALYLIHERSFFEYFDL